MTKENKSVWNNRIVRYLCTNAKHIWYALCVAFLVLVWQRVETANGAAGWIEGFRDMAGFSIAGLIVPHLELARIRKYKKLFWAWMIIGIIIIGLGIFLPIFDRNLLADRIILSMELALWGFLAIYTVLSIFKEKKYTRLNPWFMVPWGMMELWMIFSRSTYRWPLAFAGMFLIFYLTDFSREEERDIVRGMINGLILSFFCLQGWSLLYRPFDVPRYTGAFTNSSQTALFYLFVLAAVYGKLVSITRTNEHRLVKLFYWLGACVVLAFIVLPASRLGWTVGAFFTVLFLIVYSFQRGKSYLVRFGALMLVLSILLVPVCYVAVRYIPALRHHPVWLNGEYSEERVHSWDPIDSEKYRDWYQFTETISYRLKETMEAFDKSADISIVAYAKEKKDPTKYLPEEVPEKGTRRWKKWANSLPVNIEEAGNGTSTRFKLYEYCFKKMNLRGYTLSEQPFWLSHYMYAFHCHNIFLQFGTDFGWPVFYLFVGLCSTTIMVLVARGVKEIKEGRIHEENFTKLLVFLIPMTFGAMEYCWGSGSLAVILMYIIWRSVAVKGEK